MARFCRRISCRWLFRTSRHRASNGCTVEYAFPGKAARDQKVAIDSFEIAAPTLTLEKLCAVKIIGRKIEMGNILEMQTPGKLLCSATRHWKLVRKSRSLNVKRLDRMFLRGSEWFIAFVYDHHQGNGGGVGRDDCCLVCLPVRKHPRCDTHIRGALVAPSVVAPIQSQAPSSFITQSTITFHQSQAIIQTIISPARHLLINQ